MEPEPGDVTGLLAELTKGNQEAASKLMPLVYDELHRIAERHLRRERSDHTLQPTALVHEAYLKLVGRPPKEFRSRAHFLALAARVMRNILVDYARRRNAGKGPGHRVIVPLDEVPDVCVVLTPSQSAQLIQSEELLRLDDALGRLSERDPLEGKIVELRFFGGLTVDEAAEVLNVSPSTVKREWSFAKAWLHGELKQSHGNPVDKLENS